MIINIRSIYVRNTFINSIYTVYILIGYINIRSTYTRSICIKNTFIRDIKLRALIRLGVILVDLRINNYYF